MNHTKQTSDLRGWIRALELQWGDLRPIDFLFACEAYHAGDTVTMVLVELRGFYE